ncbi:MAG: TonB family protein [Acidobacteriota bacterium]
MSRPLLRKREFPPAVKTQTPDSVTVRLQVDENGNAAGIHVEKSSDPKWEGEVIAALKKWKFDPGVAAGMRVAVPLTLEFSRAGTPTASVPAPPATAPQ